MRTGPLSTLAAAILATIGFLSVNAVARPQETAAQILPAAAQIEGDADAGAESYGAECRGCHSVSIAPTLRGIAGRQIASVAGFGGYSDGLKVRRNETWTDANLDAFLKAPTEFAPGSRMVKATHDAQSRANIIAYIKTLPAPRSE